MSNGIKEALYQEWKAKEPEAAQKAYDLAQAYKAALEEKRVAQANKKKGGASVPACSSPASDKRIVHFCPAGASFLSDLLGSQCDIRPIHEISSSRSLKQAYHELGDVTHSTMFWLTLPKESMSDDAFWINLRKLF